MATRTWLYGGVDTLWTTNGNWVEGSPPSAGDAVYITGTQAPTTDATITLSLFDTTGLTGSFLTGNPSTNITISAGGTLRIGGGSQTGQHWWRGNASAATTIVFRGTAANNCYCNGALGNNADLTNTNIFHGSAGTGLIMRGNGNINASATVGTGAKFYDSSGMIAGTLGAGPSFYGNHTITCSAGNITISAGAMYIYGSVLSADAASYTITYTATVNAYLMTRNSQISFTGTQASWPVIYNFTGSKAGDTGVSV